eukprot:GGOE01021754.1.p1 GENE.GGOE01021754.1~~GGOE01021754.1.p1  ORF type:complete len:380 (+),score=78.83 GGOE01021754.1:49-1188(+)
MSSYKDSSSCTTSSVWRFKNQRNGQWTELPRKTCVILEKHRTNVFGGRPCVIELNDIEYKVDFLSSKAIDTRNFHRSIDIERVDGHDLVPATPPPHPTPPAMFQPPSPPLLAPEPSNSPPMPPPPAPMVPVQHALPVPAITSAVPPAPAPSQSLVPIQAASYAEDAPPCCKLYSTAISLNCVSIQILLKEGNVVHEVVEVDLLKGEQRTPQFRALNPAMQVPVLEDEDGTVVWESNAILRYICNTFSLDDHFYPTNNRERARLEMALDWRQTSLYPHLSKVAYPALGFSKDFAGAQAGRADLEKDLQLITTFWLKDRPFICGSRPSIADLAIACPLLLLEVTDVDILPSINAYLGRMSQEFDSWDPLTAPFLSYVDSLQ